MKTTYSLELNTHNQDIIKDVDAWELETILQDIKSSPVDTICYKGNAINHLVIKQNKGDNNNGN